MLIAYQLLCFYEFAAVYMLFYLYKILFFFMFSTHRDNVKTAVFFACALLSL